MQKAEIRGKHIIDNCAPDPPGPFDDPDPMPEVELNGPASASGSDDVVAFERAIRRAVRNLADAVLSYLDHRPDAGIVLHARLTGSDGRCVELIALKPDEAALVSARDGVCIDEEYEDC